MSKSIPSKAIVTSATRRLQQDWLELVTEPVRGVSATPVNDDLFTWHANITPSSGPYRNIIFHLHLLFPDNYPSKPPTVQLCTTFPHPNIFNGWQSNGYPYICLDMIKISDSYTTAPYTGWTTAYTVQAILMQLSAFFFDASVPQEYGGNRENRADQKAIDAAIERARNFTCTCGHTHTKPYPMIKKHKQEQQQQKNGKMVVSETSESESGVSHFTVLATVLIHHIFSFLPTSTLRNLNYACHIFRTVIDRYHMCQHRERICFHTKRSWEQEILGVGVVVTSHPTGAGIASLSTPCLDLFSRSSYDEGLRVGVWKESFTYHLPLLINTSHASRAFPLIERLFQTWCGRTFTPHMALNMCATLMNTMVVDFMKECQPIKQDVYEYEMTPIPVTLHTSEKALLGYISYHHMLLGFVQRYPVIRDIANKAVNQFYKDATYRTKEHTPNLGEFLVYLSISDLSWHDIAISFLIEMMDRDVRWMIQKRPELSKTGGTYAPTLCQRIRWSYHYAETGKKLLMFQTFFLRCVRPDGIPFNLNTTLSSYNRSLGHPPSHLAPRLQRTCRSIMSANHWDIYFDSIAVKRLSARSLYNLLTMSVIRSRDKRYHANHHIGKEKDESMKTNVGCVCEIMEGDRNKAIPILNGVVLCRCLNNDTYLRLAQGVIPKPVVIVPPSVKEEIKQEVKQVVSTPTPLTVSIASPTASPVSSPMSASTASPMSSVDVTPVTTPIASPVKAVSPVASPVSTPSPVPRIATPTLTAAPAPIIIRSSRPGGPRIVSLRQSQVVPEMVSEFGPYPGCDCASCTAQRLGITRRSRKPTGTGIPTEEERLIPVMTPEELRAHMAQYHSERKLDDAVFPALGANVTETKEYIPEGREPIQPAQRTWQSSPFNGQRQYPSRQQRDGQPRARQHRDEQQQRSYPGSQRSYNRDRQSSHTDRHVRSPVNNVRYTQRSPATAAAARQATPTRTPPRTPPRSVAAAVPPSPPSNRFLVLSADE